jgi:hypothetical protein
MVFSVQAQLGATLNYESLHTVQFEAVPEQVRHLLSHGKQSSPERKYPSKQGQYGGIFYL